MFNKDTIKFGVDWLNVRIDGVADENEFVNEFMDMFGLSGDDVLPRPSGGVSFYEKCFYVPAAGYSSILFAYNLDDDGKFLAEGGFGTPYGMFISVSGDGCRWLNHRIEDGLKTFCELVAKYNYNCTRIDMCCDFLDKENAIVPMIQSWGLAYYAGTSGIGLSCNMQKENLVKVNLVNDKLVGDYTANITVGGRSSKKGTMQLYNKRVEMETGRLSDIKAQMFEEYGVTDYWYRLEYRCKSFAQYIFDTLLNGGVYSAFLATMDKFGRFYNDIYDENNTSNCPTVVCWQGFIDYLMSFDIHFVQFVSQPYIPTSVISTIKWSKINASLLYRCTLLALQNPDLYDELLKSGQLKYENNPRYKPWREEYEILYKGGEKDA